MSQHSSQGPIVVPNGSGDASKYGKEKLYYPATSTPISSFVGMALVVAITIFTMPRPLQPVGDPTLLHVWYYGWITAISTGLGVLPLVFVAEMSDYYVGCSNAVAAGMMSAASWSLFIEGWTFDEPEDVLETPSWVRTIIGAVMGLAFILGTQKFMEKHEDIKVGGLGGADARRALLIFFVMTLHSFSEGVGIGVSFGGAHGSELGVFISASLAVHNIPEGLAIAVVLLPKKTAKLTASLWAIVTSLPQPVMAIPAYMFVNSFIPVLPVGLGFAGGAMAWVACAELLVEAYQDTDLATTVAVTFSSAGVMLWLQGAIDEGSRS